ncbi:MAG: hypothetical protein H0V62_11520 [Gammaproteobacteria bacterium]|nr:hypothetical protein [Gammaproteobacteria bacterium]
MPELDFTVEDARPEPYAAAPLLVFKLRIRNTTPTVSIRNVMLQCQLRIDATRRQYGAQDRDRLVDLFGAPERWGQTVHSQLWTHVTALVPRFDETSVVDLPVPCSFDFNVATTKYIYGLADGEVPLEFMFSGTVFYEGAEGQLQLDQISWSKEAAYRLPVKVWQTMMDLYYPNCAWLRLSRDAFDRLYRYKRERGLTSWEQAIAQLLDAEPRPEKRRALP